MAKRRTPAQRNANSAMKMAVARTEKELKPKARTKTIVTYPKGLYDKTLKKNLCKAYGELNMTDTCRTSGRSLAGKKSSSKRKSPAKQKSFMDKLLNR